MIAVLQITIDTLQTQLGEKDRQIEQLTSALVAAQQTAAQVLNAGTIRQQLKGGDRSTTVLLSRI